ncbi:PREDICTED: uncharacterized protein LOC107186444 [Dufourea novaeangliae]|uniref:uncharacterized protein LOC107186444 n=1 Tax=Dufourea novaeangliae TaxID=178035 RepID=UPI0007671DCD|nr:PREDICTED: uncharacterized protein LOC107186444 [Dufourea novaeangliae]
MQCYQRQVNSASDNVQRIEPDSYENNPIPGCSKDFGAISRLSCNNEFLRKYKEESVSSDKKMQEEAVQICNLLPKFKYDTVYATLHKNAHAENRVVLSLWDLLPYARPVVEVFKKSSNNEIVGVNSGNSCNQVPSKLATVHQRIIDRQDNSMVLINNVKQNRKEIICNKQLNDDVVIVNDTDVNSDLNRESVSNIVALEKDATSHINFKNKEKLNYSRKGAKVRSRQNGILHPAKLVLKNKSSVVQSDISCKSPILSPSKLTHVTSNMHENPNSRKILTPVRKYKGNQLTNKKWTQGNVLPSNSMGMPINNPIKANQKMLNNYMHYLRFMQGVKKQKLFGKLQDFNGSRNEIRQMFLHPNLKNPNINMLQRINQKSSAMSTSYNTLDNTSAIEFEDLTENASISKMSETSIGASDTEVVDIIEDQDLLESAPTSLESANLVNATVTTSATPCVTSVIASANDEVSNEPSTSAQSHKDLKFIFPDIDKNFIKELCSGYSTSNDSSEILQDLSDYILENMKECPVKKNNKHIHKKETDNMEKQVTYLSGIFPKADVTYLSKFVQRAKGNENAIINFIQSQCKSPTYPTKEEKLRRIRITEQQKQYTSNFDTRKFLKILPDPFKHFENVNRQCKFNSDAYEFLKSHFQKIPEETLTISYKNNKYNLSLTAHYLEQLNNGPPCQTGFSWERNPSEDIPLLQECAFITHKVQIRDCKKKLQEEESRELDILKRNNELFECQCCYDTECVPTKCSTCDDGHIFCNPCVIKGTEMKLSQGETRISCFINCGAEFSLSTLQRILPPTQFSILIGKIQEAEVMAAGLEGLVSCPFCPFASIPPVEDKVFKCLNPECMKESCRLCKELNHVPLKCYAERTDKARLFLEEKMTEALVRKCKRCSRPYFKEDGCNKITCSCRAQMCYICDEEITGYDHFDRMNVLTQRLCPLHSNSVTLNDQTVEAVANETLKYIAEKDPNVKVDMSSLVKTGKSTIYTADVLERVQKIANFNK